ncbi:MAG: hypothetical protein JW940_02715 [Polyangiaceae bacterium]|nr:hypothetical protein [Polyangiaceae bacterium]
MRAEVAPLIELVEALAPAQKPALMTAAQLADELQVCSKTISRLVAEGMPFVAVVDSKRFQIGECLAWLRARGAR